MHGRAKPRLASWGVARRPAVYLAVKPSNVCRVMPELWGLQVRGIAGWAADGGKRGGVGKKLKPCGGKPGTTQGTRRAERTGEARQRRNLHGNK